MSTEIDKRFLLRLTAIVFTSPDNPSVWVGRLAEVGGIYSQASTLREALSDLDKCAWHMLHSYKQTEADALFAQQQPELVAQGETYADLDIVHDEDASAKEQAMFREAGRRADAATKERMIPASEVAQQLAGLLPPTSAQLAKYDAPLVKEMSDFYRERITAAATALGLTLP